MKTSSLIGHTAELYDLVFRDRRPADAIFDSFFRSHKYLGSHDRRFIAETVYGMVRMRRLVEWALPRSGYHGLLADGSPDPSRTVVLCLAYRALFSDDRLETVVAEATLNDEARATLLPVLNGVRKQVDDLRRQGGGDDAERLALSESFPDWMVAEWISTMGFAGAAKLCAALNAPAPLTLRVNTIRATVEECRKSLEAEGIETTTATYAPSAIHLRKRINVFSLETFKKGFFEVQDEASQLVALLVDPKPTSKVVDACAGGGGKTLAMAAVMKNRGVITALDTSAYRLQGLKKRLRRAGADTVRIREVGDEVPADLVGAADNVLVDAPCSGLGTIRRNPGMKWSVTPEAVAELHTKQLRLLSRYSACVKPKGRLVYATCTTMHAENESVVEEFLSAHPDFTLMHPSSILERYGCGNLGEEKYLRLLPHVHGTDGFFAAVLRRSEPSAAPDATQHDSDTNQE